MISDAIAEVLDRLHGDGGAFVTGPPLWLPCGRTELMPRFPGYGPTRELEQGGWQLMARQHQLGQAS
jgi:hypothetical protein